MENDEPKQIYSSKDYFRLESELEMEANKIRNSSIFRFNTHLLERMIKGSLIDTKKLYEGSNVVLSLSNDAVWYDGSTPAPTVNMQGYELFKGESKEDLRPGERITARVYKIDLDEGRLILSSAFPNQSVMDKKMGKLRHDLEMFYVDSRVIRDFQILD